MHWLVVLVILSRLVFAPAFQQGDQNNLEITDLGMTYQFGESLTFQVRVQPVADIDKLLVYIQPEGGATVWNTVDLKNASPLGEVTQVVDARRLSLAPFSQISYWYEATMKDGSMVPGEKKTFAYNDTRFTWQTVKSGIFEIHWNGSDATQGQELANIAQQGLTQAQKIISVNPPASVRIFAYSSARDLQTALQMTNQPQLAGHTTPDLNLILVSVPAGPERKLEMERQVPHEIMHILQYQVMGSSYTNEPMWLIEGMASLAELYPNPEYARVLENTPADQLISFQNLCGGFSRDAAAQFLAYAESESFTRFLLEKYGATGLRSLIDQYKNGLGCDEGAHAALGASLGQLETRWRQEVLGQNVSGLVLNNLSPYLLLGLLILLPAALVIIPGRLARSGKAQEKRA